MLSKQLPEQFFGIHNWYYISKLYCHFEGQVRTRSEELYLSLTESAKGIQGG